MDTSYSFAPPLNEMRVRTFVNPFHVPNKKMEECAVCLEETLDRVKPCGHAVCKSCTTRWIARNKCTCPMCRQPMLADLDDTTSDKAILIDPRTGTFFGVTVCNTVSGEGVRVTQTNPVDLVHASGIRSGMVITHINGMPVNEHQVAILLLNNATASQTRVRLRIRSPIVASIISTAGALHTAVSRRFRRPNGSAIWRMLS